MRQCKLCGKFEEIHKKLAKCKACTKVANREYYLEHRDKMIEDAKVWRSKNGEKYSEYMVKRQKVRWPELKAQIFAHYGSRCACCGEANIKFLTIDHVNNDGNKHRKEMNNAQLYAWLLRNNFECEYELQVMCFNCNFGKRYNGGICPHCTTEPSETIPQGSTPKWAEAHSTER